MRRGISVARGGRVCPPRFPFRALAVLPSRVVVRALPVPPLPEYIRAGATRRRVSPSPPDALGPSFCVGPAARAWASPTSTVSMGAGATCFRFPPFSLRALACIRAFRGTADPVRVVFTHVVVLPWLVGVMRTRWLVEVHVHIVRGMVVHIRRMAAWRYRPASLPWRANQVLVYPSR